MKGLANITRLQVVMIIVELILLVAQIYLVFIKGDKPKSIICGLILIIVSIFNMFLGSFVKYTSREIIKCARHVDIVDNIIQVTALNYFYAKKYHMRFDIEKIKRELNQDDLQIVAVPDMFDEEPASDEEIAESIEFMKDWNIGIIHRVLTTSLLRGDITGSQRRLLIKHALSGINNISDNSFVWKKREDGSEYYKVYYNFEDESLECL